MNIAAVIPERIKEKFLNEVLEMYAEGEISAGRAAEMRGSLVQPSIAPSIARACW